jgi:predicted TPR repeat methyltransferase
VGEAVALIQVAVQAHPEQPEFHNSLGAAFIAAGRSQDAERALLRAVQLRPTYVKAIRSLVVHGSREAARTALAAYIEADPEDAIGAAVQLAALGAADAPSRASGAHMLQFYGERASSWEGGNGYRHADVVADQLIASLPPGRSVLDAGCGTGLVGSRVRPYVSRFPASIFRR